MALDYNDRALQRDVSRVLVSLRLSFERVLIREGNLSLGKRGYKEAIGYLDELRFAFHSLDHLGSKLNEKSFLGIASDLQNGVDAFLRSAEFRRLSADIPFSFLSARATEKFWLSHKFLSSISVLEASELLLEALSERTGEEHQPFESEIINVYIPEQNAAPLIFEIVEEVLTPVTALDPPDAADLRGAEAARKNLIESGFKLLDELSRSNHDKRLHDSVETVTTKLLGSANIVDVGLSFSQVSVLTGALQDELPASVSGMIDSFYMNGRMYLHQFPDWSRFIEKAGQAELDDSSIQAIEQATQATIQSLEERPEIATDEVPATFRFLARLATSPASEGKKASYALFRSLENLVIAVFKYLKDMAISSFNTAKDDVAQFGGKVLARALVLTALGTAIALSPVARSLPDGGWLARAIEAVQRQADNWTNGP